MKIKETATFVSKGEIIIDAPIEDVWKLQTDINNWPSWQKDVTSAKLLGKLEAGTVFEWKAAGMNITSVLQDVCENKIIGWSGKSLGMSAVHYWYFEKQGNKTKVTSEESMTGWLPKIIKLFKPNFLDEALRKSLNTLKTQLEAN